MVGGKWPQVDLYRIWGENVCSGACECNVLRNGGGGGGPVHAYVVNPPQHAWLHPVSSSCLCALYFSKRFAKFSA